MSASRIEQLIEDIYEFVESCKLQTFSSSKVIVPKDELYDLLDELRLRTPDEIKRYQKIIANRDMIMKDAEEKAKAILEEAQERTNAMINESEIVQQSYQQANAIVERANEEANRILREANSDATQLRHSALQYTEDVLTEAEQVLLHSYESTKSRYESLVDTLRGNWEVVVNNKKEITEQLYGESSEAAQEERRTTNETPEDNSDVFDFDENTFLEDIEDLD